MPEQTSIPIPVRELLREAIHSLEQLEILLRLVHAAPAARTPGELVDALGLSHEQCRSALDHLVARGLVMAHAGAPPCWVYAPRSDKLNAQVAQLVSYDTRGRVELMVQISDNAVGRVRRGALRMLGEMLWLRKNE